MGIQDKGGILVTNEELQAAFDFFDVNKTGKITLAALKNRLGAFYKNVPTREYKFLMNNQAELTIDDLRSLLEHNEITNFDPVAEAFKVYDPEDTGFIDTGTLRSIFEKLGFGQISDDDVQILVETADCDGDGKISLDDFRKMIDQGVPEAVNRALGDVEDEAQPAS